MAANAERLLIACGLLVVLAACRVEHDMNRVPLSPVQPGATRTQVKQVFDPKSGRLLHEWTQLTFTDRRPIKDGAETKYSASGAKVWEGHWKNGEKHGVWRFFYADGQIKSQTSYLGPRTSALQTFWHPNGQVSLQGPAIDGVRQGVWRIWRKDGTLAEEGSFLGSLREGPWKVYSEDGKLVTEVVYQRNLRVSSGAPQPLERPDVKPLPADDAPAGQVGSASKTQPPR